MLLATFAICFICLFGVCIEYSKAEMAGWSLLWCQCCFVERTMFFSTSNPQYRYSTLEESLCLLAPVFVFFLGPLSKCWAIEVVAWLDTEATSASTDESGHGGSGFQPNGTDNASIPAQKLRRTCGWMGNVAIWIWKQYDLRLGCTFLFVTQEFLSFLSFLE